MPEVGPAQSYMEDRIHIPGSSPVSRGKKNQALCICLRKSTNY